MRTLSQRPHMREADDSMIRLLSAFYIKTAERQLRQEGHSHLPLSSLFRCMSHSNSNTCQQKLIQDTSRYFRRCIIDGKETPCSLLGTVQTWVVDSEVFRNPCKVLRLRRCLRTSTNHSTIGNDVSTGALSQQLLRHIKLQNTSESCQGVVC